MEKAKRPGSLFRLAMALKDFFNPREWLKTLRAVPGMVLALITVSMILMNILANKAIIELKIPGTDSYWLIQDAGVMLSWVGFLAGDLLTKNFGAKHAIRVNLTALFLSLFVSLLLLGAAAVPGTWSPQFGHLEDHAAFQAVGAALNEVIGNVWHVVLGSAAASACGLVVNNLTQDLLLKRIEKRHGNKYWGYLLASASSSFLGQFIDNFVFAAIVSIHFFGWTWLSAVMCSLDGAILEILLELVFLPLTFAIAKNWDKNHIGAKYLEGEKPLEAKR